MTLCHGGDDAEVDEEGGGVDESNGVIGNLAENHRAQDYQKWSRECCNIRGQ